MGTGSIPLVAFTGDRGRQSEPRIRPRLATITALSTALLAGLLAAPALGQPEPATRPAGAASAAASAPAGRTYAVSKIAVQYTPGSATPVREQEIFTGATPRFRPLPGGGGYDADPAAPGRPLSNFSSGKPVTLTAAAVDEVKTAVRDYLNARGTYAVIVDAKPPADGGGLVVEVTVGKVTRVRTVASGTRLMTSPPREDNPAHEFIRVNSPVTTAAPNNSVNKPALDDYVLWLNRHPGRRVDLALSPAATPPGVEVDYLVTESKPWSVLFQLSNTGTEQTNEWRERFAFSHNQLTGHDDVFNVEYNTAGFEDSHTFNVSYELPISADRKLRVRGYGLYSEFVASDVGFQGQDFLGNEAVGGVEVIYNLSQWRETFLDVVGGVKAQWAKVRSRIDFEEIDGEATFFEPYAGVRVGRATDVDSLGAGVTLMAGFSDADQSELDKLRIDADSRFVVIQFEAGYTTFLEPIFQRQKFEAGQGTLAHELAVSVRGQYAFGDRMIPQNQETAGGLYTVRGYEESESAGDSVILGTVEYRLHIPRLFEPKPNPTPLFPQWTDRPFRFAPETRFGAADWDLVARGFIDAAQVVNHEPLVFEHDNTLLSVGLGLELQYRDNIAVRVDWGVALTETRRSDGTGTEPGDNRFHFVFTATY